MSFGAFDERDNERGPYFEACCNQCGATWHAPDGDCPSCGSASYSYDRAAAHDYTSFWDERDGSYR